MMVLSLAIFFAGNEVGCESVPCDTYFYPQADGTTSESYHDIRVVTFTSKKE